jgi:hypothetical protein
MIEHDAAAFGFVYPADVSDNPRTTQGTTVCAEKLIRAGDDRRINAHTYNLGRAIMEAKSAEDEIALLRRADD